MDRWECGQPIFNRHYLGFASHYGSRHVRKHLSAMGAIMEKYMEKLVRQKKDATAALNSLLALKVHYHTEDILKAVDMAMKSNWVILFRDTPP